VDVGRRRRPDAHALRSLSQNLRDPNAPDASASKSSRNRLTGRGPRSSGRPVSTSSSDASPRRSRSRPVQKAVEASASFESTGCRPGRARDHNRAALGARRLPRTTPRRNRQDDERPEEASRSGCLDPVTQPADSDQRSSAGAFVSSLNHQGPNVRQGDTSETFPCRPHRWNSEPAFDVRQRTGDNAHASQQNNAIEAPFPTHPDEPAERSAIARPQRAVGGVDPDS
jgi:hypothetical protein